MSGLIMLPASGNNPFILNLSDLQNQAKPLPSVTVTSTLPLTTTTP